MIPVEVIIDYVIPYVDLSTLLNMELVSVTWSRAASHPYVWGKHITIYKRESLQELTTLMSFFTIKQSYFLLNRLHRLVLNFDPVIIYYYNMVITYRCQQMYGYELDEAEATAIRLLLPRTYRLNKTMYSAYMYYDEGWVVDSGNTLVQEIPEKRRRCKCCSIL